MTRCLYSRLWQLPRRPIFVVRHRSRSFYSHAPVNANSRAPYLGPSSSQLLRFALTGTSQSTQSGLSNPELDRRLEESFSEEWRSKPSPASFWTSTLQKIPLPDNTLLQEGLQHRVQNLADLQILIERNVNGKDGAQLLQLDRCSALAHALERCEPYNSSGEILSAVNGIISRLERLELPLSSDLYVLGMFYASLALSESALHRHLQGYLNISSQPLDLESSTFLVYALLSSLRTLSFQDTEYDITKIVDLVTGESGSTPTLHSILFWAKPKSSTELIGKYLSLLVKLHSDATLREMWDRTLEQLSPDSTFDRFQSAYTCVRALADAGNPSRALTYLTQISERAKSTLPGISKLQDLNNFLSYQALSKALPRLAGVKEYTLVLEAQLGAMEKRLGIVWQRDKGLHASISDSISIATEQPFLTIDGDAYGYDSSERLVSEIEALGCSKSIADLEKIPDLLDEFEGELIAVSMLLPHGSPASDYYWIPQRSLIEFYDTFLMSSDFPSTDVYSALGLIRVRPAHDYPLALERSFHLIQLGYLVKQQAPSREGNSTLSPNLEKTGHIVTWDRASGQFVIVYVGKSYGRVDSHIEWQPSSIPFGLPAITEIRSLSDISDVSSNHPSLFDTESGEYYIDVDPSPDLAR